jgi:hypothetical protein
MADVGLLVRWWMLDTVVDGVKGWRDGMSISVSPRADISGSPSRRTTVLIHAFCCGRSTTRVRSLLPPPLSYPSIELTRPPL